MAPLKKAVQVRIAPQAGRRRPRSSPPSSPPPLADPSIAAEVPGSPRAPPRSSPATQQNGGAKARDSAATGGGSPPARRRAVAALPVDASGFPSRVPEKAKKSVLAAFLDSAAWWFRRAGSQFRPPDYERRSRWFWETRVPNKKLRQLALNWADHYDQLPADVRGKQFERTPSESPSSSSSSWRIRRQGAAENVPPSGLVAEMFPRVRGSAKCSPVVFSRPFSGPTSL
eukprot:gene1093-biopygen13332